MINPNLESHYSLFSNGQGSGYIFEDETEINQYIQPISICIGSKTINPGDMTDLDNYLTQKVKYLGVVNDRGMIFYYGKDQISMFPRFYYGLIWYISSTRIFEMYSERGGRDHNFKNGKWK